ncbi:MAG: thiazole biosynthesis adenylyltransferase ThiF [Phycisphaerales bacterium]|nr:MAG: thiazole biosynthesis adenylyltransferase ThiF [Phycisphaerales bacterium]
MHHAHRHHRQSILPVVGDAGQERLSRSHALVVGVGALGCVSAELLARAGVGTITLVDRDVVETTNLQRQTLYTDADAREGAPKADAAARRLRAIDPALDVRAVVADFTHRNAETLCDASPPVGVIVDGLDNYETRYLLNDLSVSRAIPLIYGGAVATHGMQMNVLAGVDADAPCLRCVFPEAPPEGARETCDSAGVLAPAPAVIGALQAAEALKALLGRTDAMRRSLLRIDVWTGDLGATRIAGAKDPDCPCCARRDFASLRGAGARDATTLCGRSSVQISPSGAGVDLDAIAARLARSAAVTRNTFLVRADLEGERGEGDAPIQLTVFGDGRAIISGTAEPARARSIHAKYVGA